MSTGTPEKAVPEDAGRTCPYCRFPLKEGVRAVACASCNTLHHEECWQDGRGCAIFGCAGSHTPVRGDATPASAPRVSTADGDNPSPTLNESAGVSAAHRGDGAASRRWRAASLKYIAPISLVLVTAAIAAVVLTSTSKPEIITRIVKRTTTVVMAGTASTTTATVGSTPATTPTATDQTSPRGLVSYAGPSYSIDYPAGWLPGESNQSSGAGRQNESTWESPDNSAISMLVDDSARRAGETDESGATPVRDQVAQSSTYEQLAWGPVSLQAGTAWQWRFQVADEETVDTFYMTCNTGYGILERAPISSFPKYAALFSNITNSFRPATPC